MFEGTGYWNGMENIVFDSDYIICSTTCISLGFLCLAGRPWAWPWGSCLSCPYRYHIGQNSLDCFFHLDARQWSRPEQRCVCGFPRTYFVAWTAVGPWIFGRHVRYSATALKAMGVLVWIYTYMLYSLHVYPWTCYARLCVCICLYMSHFVLNSCWRDFRHSKSHIV